MRTAYENRLIFSQCLSKEYTLRVGGDLRGEEKHPTRHRPSPAPHTHTALAFMLQRRGWFITMPRAAFWRRITALVRNGKQSQKARGEGLAEWRGHCGPECHVWWQEYEPQKFLSICWCSLFLLFHLFSSALVSCF